MNYIRGFAWSVAISTASLLAGCMNVSDSAEPAIGEAEGALAFYNVRLGPSLDSGIKYQIPGGTQVTIKCATSDFAGNTWYQLTDGGFILASIVRGPLVVLSCSSPDIPPGGIGATVRDD